MCGRNWKWQHNGFPFSVFPFSKNVSAYVPGLASGRKHQILHWNKQKRYIAQLWHKQISQEPTKMWYFTSCLMTLKGWTEISCLFLRLFPPNLNPLGYVNAGLGRRKALPVGAKQKPRGERNARVHMRLYFLVRCLSLSPPCSLRTVRALSHFSHSTRRHPRRCCSKRFGWSSVLLRRSFFLCETRSDGFPYFPSFFVLFCFVSVHSGVSFPTPPPSLKMAAGFLRKGDDFTLCFDFSLRQQLQGQKFFSWDLLHPLG